MNCQLCGEPYEPGDREVGPIGMSMHRECGLRNALGGIGHLMDHPHYCGELHDPDGGFTYRESAKLVALWVALKGGVEALLDE